MSIVADDAQYQTDPSNSEYCLEKSGLNPSLNALETHEDNALGIQIEAEVSDLL